MKRIFRRAEAPFYGELDRRMSLPFDYRRVRNALDMDEIVPAPTESAPKALPLRRAAVGRAAVCAATVLVVTALLGVGGWMIQSREGGGFFLPGNRKEPSPESTDFPSELPLPGGTAPETEATQVPEESAPSNVPPPETNAFPDAPPESPDIRPPNDEWDSPDVESGNETFAPEEPAVPDAEQGPETESETETETDTDTDTESRKEPTP